MARIPRIKIEDEDTVYHIGARVAGPPKWFPFDDPVARHKLEELIRFYTEAYSCKVASFSLMSNHYRILLRFEAFRQLSRIELEERAALLYASPDKVLVSDRDWERFNRRLYDLSELMRNIQGDYAKWYNRNYGRRGSLWAERFHSTVVLGSQAIQETLAYIELNPVRANLVERPEDHRSSSACLRQIGADGWLMPLAELFDGPDHMGNYRNLLYYRGFEGGSKEGARISASTLQQEQKRGFRGQGVYRKRLRYFLDGLVLGNEERIKDWITLFQLRGHYSRPREPIGHLEGLAFTLRDQRTSRKPVPS